MRKTAMKAVLLLLAAMLTGALVAAQDEGQEESQGNGEVVEIRMVTDGSEFYFDPVGIHVEPGTTIRFINESGQHTATAYCEENGKPQRIPEGAECWDSGMLVEEGATFEVTLTEEGVYDYYCAPHEALGMVGRIVVGSAEAFPAQDPGDLMPAVQEELPAVEEIMNAENRTLPYGDGAQ